MSDLIDREALLRQIDIDSEGEPGYYGDTWKFIDTIKSMPPAELSTNMASPGTDCISRQAAIDAVMECYDNDELLMVYVWKLNELPAIQPKKGKWIEIEAFSDCRYVKCDQCKTVEVFYYGKRNTNFCPNCGADMRQKGENSENN